MRRDKISREEVLACLESPESTEPSIKGRMNYWRRREDGYLRVTAIEEAESFAITTVVLRRKGPEGLV